MLIRRAGPSDVGAVRRVHLAAFEGPAEAALVNALREGGHAAPALSLVALSADDEVVGHVVCSRGSIGERPSLGLGPIGVLPDHQGAGIGSALMHAVIGAADALDEPCIALLGNPALYGRFGFVASTRYRIDPPDPAWGEYFQVRTLSTWGESARNESISGTFTYAAPFDDL
jgi:putative acetyltransferase